MRIDWKKADIRGLGSAPDRVIARQRGVSLSTISRRRWEARIPAYARHATTRRYLDLLAAHPEGLTTRAIAERVGVTRQAVHIVLKPLVRKGWVRAEHVPELHQAGLAPTVWWLAEHHGEEPT
mgnify:CR=1 FL=1